MHIDSTDSKLNKEKAQQNQTHLYACFEQAETVKVLNYLTKKDDNTIIFKSAGEQQNKRNKQFAFQKITQLTQKFKFNYNHEVKNIINGLLKGQNQTALIYGTDESKKDKILIGESQNPGLLLTTLSELFETCYQREIEDEVTIKISCSMFKDGKFSDVFGATDEPFMLSNKNNLNSVVAEKINGNIVCQDIFQGKYLLGIPQVIIRNMKTALKIINTLYKRIIDTRQKKQEQSQNLIFTIKLQIDNGLNKQQNVNQYLISKFNIVKLANPSIIQSTKSSKNNNNWFINLFNFLQSENLQKDKQKFQNQNQQGLVSSKAGENEFVSYLKTSALLKIKNLYNFTIITNKMTSNQCLTAFKFATYLSSYKTPPVIIQINLDSLKNEKMVNQNELMTISISYDNFFNKQNRQDQRSIVKEKAGGKDNKQNDDKYDDEKKLLYDCLVLEHEQNLINFHKMLQKNKEMMIKSNLVEYQYANIMTEACDRLQKYIFNEQVQDYFYAKKISTEINSDIRNAIFNLFQQRLEINQIMGNCSKKVNISIVKIKKIKQTYLSDKQNKDSKDLKFLLNNKLKQKRILERLFEIYNTSTLHFLYQQNQQLGKFLNDHKLRIAQKLISKISHNNYNYEQIISHINNSLLHSPIKQPNQKEKPQLRKKQQNKNDDLLKKINPIKKQGVVDLGPKDFIKKRKNVNEMQKMFTNANACLGTYKFNPKFKN